jgi:hypothetical protein
METTCKKCGSENVMGVEYTHGNPEHYDGVSEIACNECRARFGRFSGRELAEGETEKASARFA